MSEPSSVDTGTGAPGSFAIPRAAVGALLREGATALEICAYLVLARFSDRSGRYSTASVNAISRYTGSNKTVGGSIARAIDRLQRIRGFGSEQVTEVKDQSTRSVHKVVPRAPIVVSREAWPKPDDVRAADGPTERSSVRFVLPDFDEEPSERVWLSNAIVDGIGRFDRPLRALKNAGDEAARLLLVLYLNNDMYVWGGVDPTLEGSPYVSFEKVFKDEIVKGGARLIRARRRGVVFGVELQGKVSRAPRAQSALSHSFENAQSPGIRALEALLGLGMVYEVVMVLNRDAVPLRPKLAKRVYSGIPMDAEPLYELDTLTRSLGFKPRGEEGIGVATAKTAKDLGFPVTLPDGRFDGTYAAFVQQGVPAMLAGIVRLRFRVNNVKNAGVRGAWLQIYQGNTEALDFLQKVRRANRLTLPKPILARDKVPSESAGKEWTDEGHRSNWTASDIEADDLASDELFEQRSPSEVVIPVHIPQLSEGVTKASLTRWRIEEGESVRMNDLLVEVETDKVVIEIVAPVSGWLERIAVSSGETVVAEQLIAVICPN